LVNQKGQLTSSKLDEGFWGVYFMIDEKWLCTCSMHDSLGMKVDFLKDALLNIVDQGIGSVILA
jgi:hypothetical protein